MARERVLSVLRRWAAPLAIGVLLGAAGMQGLHAQQQGIKRTPLVKADLTGVAGTEVIMTLVEAQPGAAFPSHIHHGDEFSYVIEGTLSGEIQGKAPFTVKAGEPLHVERELVHSGKVVGDTPVKLLTVHIVDKGKPLSEAAK